MLVPAVRAQGCEASVRAELKRPLLEEALADAFVLRKECWVKRQDRRFLQPVNIYRGHAFAVSVDGAAHIAKIDRHRRRCQVRVGDGDEASIEQAAIDVPFRS